MVLISCLDPAETFFSIFAFLERDLGLGAFGVVPFFFFLDSKSQRNAANE